jgi:hypothetical protein
MEEAAMDWDGVIEKNREALKRVVAMLVAMAGLAGLASPLAGEDGSARRGEAEALAEPGEGQLSASRFTLPRHLHRAVLRLLRPAEAAARRLVIVCARDIVLPTPAPPRPRKPKPDAKAAQAALRSLGIAIVMTGAGIARAGSGKRAAARAGRPLLLPLVDPLRPPRFRRRTVAPRSAPRILSFDGIQPHRLPPPASPNDPLDATRLRLRLEALSSALDNLPKHAQRFARWRTRRERGLVRRVSPLRPGRPPGLSAANRRRPTHEIHEVLADMQYFAFKALERPDTS